MPRWQARAWERENNCSPYGNTQRAAPVEDVEKDDDWVTPPAIAGGVLVLVPVRICL